VRSTTAHNLHESYTYSSKGSGFPEPSQGFNDNLQFSTFNLKHIIGTRGIAKGANQP
jgi:hypothetical protein